MSFENEQSKNPNEKFLENFSRQLENFCEEEGYEFNELQTEEYARIFQPLKIFGADGENRLGLTRSGAEELLKSMNERFSEKYPDYPWNLILSIIDTNGVVKFCADLKYIKTAEAVSKLTEEEITPSIMAEETLCDRLDELQLEFDINRNDSDSFSISISDTDGIYAEELLGQLRLEHTMSGETEHAWLDDLFLSFDKTSQTAVFYYRPE